MPKIVRLTLFKIPDEGMVKEAIQMYNTLAQDAKKVRRHIPDSLPSRLKSRFPFPGLHTYPLSREFWTTHGNVHSDPARQSISSPPNPRL
jgi:hypothetical protein